MDNFQLEDSFDAILDIIDEGAENAAFDTAEVIAADAQAQAPVLHGALRAGIYAAKAGDTSAYEGAAGEVHKANPRAGVMPGAGLEDFSGEGVHSAVAESIVDYSPLIHNGYGNRSGRPFLENAFDNNEGTFQDNLNGIADDLRPF